MPLIIKNRTTSIIASGGVATYVETSFPSYEIQLTTEIEAVAVVVHMKQKFTICNVYIPPSKLLTSQELCDLYQQLPQPCLIVGDFNAHNTLWGSSSTTRSGTEVEKFIDLCNLCLLNNGEPTRVNLASDSMSAIDLSLCDP